MSKGGPPRTERNWHLVVLSVFAASGAIACGEG